MLERLETALEESVSWDDVVTRLLRVVGEDEREAARPFVYAFSYVLLDPDAEEARQAAGGPIRLVDRDRWCAATAAADGYRFRDRLGLGGLCDANR